MATSVTLPALGESVTEGTVTRWLKQPGEEVQVDEPLLEISTDKVDTEIPSPVAGTLLEIKVDEDETVEVGAELAIIGDASEAGGDGGGQEDTAEEAPQADTDQEEPLLEEPGSRQQATEEPAAEEATAEAEPEQAEAEPEQAETEPEQAETEATAAESEQQAGGTGDGTPVTLPALGESVTEGTVTRWLKEIGDEVAADEPLLEISTDKVDTEIPSPVAGTLLEIKVDEDETVEVGAELAIIGAAGAASSAPPAREKRAEEPEAEEEPAEPQPAKQQDADEEATLETEAQERAAAEAQSVQTAETKPAAASAPEPAEAAAKAQPAPSREAAAPSGDGAPYVTPLVRKLAAEHSVDLSTIEGTGVGGRIRKQDVLAAAEAAKTPAAPAEQPPSEAPAAPSPPAVEPSPLRGKTEKLSRIRKVIAQRVHESLQNTAQLTTVIEVDVTAIAKLRDQAKRSFEQQEGVKLSFLPFFAKAALEALKAHPKINASIDVDAGEVTYHDSENLGLAVDTERGLMVPVLHNAGDLNIAGLAKRIADLAARTRDNKLKPDDVAGGTFTLTNTGSRGALFDTPIFFEPQVAILGTGAVVKRPVVMNTELGETIAIRHMVYLALSYDHRLIDGADAARFLNAIKQRLEGGQFEGDLGG
ncbi:MAG TPA: 2-oxoglutarate dehydrogenase, E2 component, dihydrolipoamide succinyltransferase [Jiangellaceae bacterium]|nr:2-oxoglutarate dehydrogenase, E2 component, dihydrolipoamide succinyltransferase [Jiangellaceae bacterium]